MKIRNYTEEDRDQVVSLWNSVLPGSVDHNNPEIVIDRKTAADDGLFFVAVDNDVILGTIIAGYDGHRGWLYSVAVNEQFRRQGVGSRLVRHAEAALTKLGCLKLNLQIRENNADVTAFYEAIGFDTEKRISMGKRLPLN